MPTTVERLITNHVEKLAEKYRKQNIEYDAMHQALHSARRYAETLQAAIDKFFSEPAKRFAEMEAEIHRVSSINEDLSERNELYCETIAEFKSHELAQQAKERIANGASPKDMAHIIERPLSLSTPITHEEYRKGEYTAMYYSLEKIARGFICG